jgi:predicted Zn-dependent protease
LAPGNAFAGLDSAAVARALAAVADRADDLAEVYFERRVELELPPPESGPGLRERREEGLAVRLVRGRRAWSASRDRIGSRELEEALRQVARVLPAAAPAPEVVVEPWRPELPGAELAALPGELERALRRRHVAFPMRVRAAWQRRDSRVVAPRWSAPAEREAFFAVDVELPWGRCGALETRLDAAAAERLAQALLARFRAREAAPPGPGRPPLLLAPSAAAVLLHEGVAHAFEADLMALAGGAEAAIGRQLGPAGLHVLDDPARAPAGVERATDDEGRPVERRWLLRAGRLEQPLADARAARDSALVAGGSGFRAHRHAPPRPRTLHLELLSGPADRAELFALAEGGLYLAEIDAGRLDPRTGEIVLHAPCARRVAGGAPGEPVGPFRVRCRVADLLGAVVAIGADAEPAGAGWCAKAGERRAVWATVPHLLLEGPEVQP